MTDPHARPFADWLREQAGGRTHDELTQALAEVATAVKETGKKGSLTLTITLAPIDRGASAVTVADQVKKTVPVHDRRKPIFYVDDAGSLVRDDPNQPTFEGLREVPTPAEPLTITSKEQHA